MNILGDGVGRAVIYTDEREITSENIIKVLQETFPSHIGNAQRIDELIRFEAGVQEQLRAKVTRKEIDSKCVDNVANEITEFKTSFVWGNPITLVQRGEKDSGKKAENKAITRLNECYSAEFIGRKQQELARFVEIGGIGFTFIDINRYWREGKSYFTYDVLDPRYAYIVKSSSLGHRKMLGVTYSTDTMGNFHFTAFTPNARFEIDSLLRKEPKKENSDNEYVRNYDWQERPYNNQRNPLGMIPIIEWVRASDRMGCFERQIPEMLELNQLESDFSNLVGQTVNSIWWANNVEFPEETVTDRDGNEIKTVSHPENGDWIETNTTRDGKDPKIEPLVINSDYNGQLNNIVTKRSLILEKCQVPQRGDSSNSTGIATSAASGWDAAESSASKEQMYMESSKLEEVEVVLSAINASPDIEPDNPMLELKYMDVQPSIKRQKNYELVSKMNFFATGISHGLHPKHLLKEMNAFADPEQVYIDSKEYLDMYIESTLQKNNGSSGDGYNGYGWYRKGNSDTGDGGSGEDAPNKDRLGQDESDQVENSPNVKG